MGADAVWLMLMMQPAFCMPARYCTEPEMATLRMNFGLTVVPLWPIWLLVGHPAASQSGLEQASSPPMRPASLRARRGPPRS